MSGTVLIIGGNGRLGRVLVDAFVQAGWKVHAQVRRQPERALAGVKWVELPLAQPAGIADAVRAADVVVHTANPAYTKWAEEAPPLLQQSIQVAQRLSAWLFFPGNVYNFGAGMPPVLTESTPQNPTTRKGRIRVRLEQTLREAAAAGTRVVVVRAGDFFGGPGRGSWIDLIIAKSLRKGVAVYPGPLDAPHAWAYLPDLARTFVAVAEHRAKLAIFETVHFPGHTLTGEDLLEALALSARRQGLLLPNVPLRRRSLPWPLLRVAGLVAPMLREVAEMSYLWSVPHRLSGERLSGLIGTVPQTPLPQAMDDTLRALYRR
jgi:nucleoside-diphosphate-sugar epimerase